MKLLATYYRANIAATLIIVLISSIGYYFIIHHILIEQLDGALIVEEEEVIDHLNKYKSLPEPSSYSDQFVSFKQSAAPVTRNFTTINFFDNEENENILARQLVFPVNVNEKHYAVYVTKSQEETEDLVRLILISTLIIVISLLLILFLVNRLVLRRLWKPFESTINELKHFNLSKSGEIKLIDSNIDEFRELNHAVKLMSVHVDQEYQALKRFTDNASHEMQTPLAVINSKLDLLIQGNLTEMQMEQLQVIYNSLEKLSRLNQSLLLLTKIENNQFKEQDFYRLDELIKEKLVQYEELISAKNLEIITSIEQTSIRGNKDMLDMLLNNLFGNATRYNKPYGKIKISLEEKILTVSNESYLPELDKELLFQRFYRHENTSTDGNGLGLSIIKQLCHEMGYTIGYRYNNHLHEFSINLQAEKV